MTKTCHSAVRVKIQALMFALKMFIASLHQNIIVLINEIYSYIVRPIFSCQNVGSSGIWTWDLVHPKHKSYSPIPTSYLKICKVSSKFFSIEARQIHLILCVHVLHCFSSMLLCSFCFDVEDKGFFNRPHY